MQNFVEELGMTGSTSFFTAALVGLSSFILFQFQRIWTYQKKLAVVERQQIASATDSATLSRLEENNLALHTEVQSLKQKNDTLSQQVQSLQSQSDDKTQEEVASARQDAAKLRKEMKHLVESQAALTREKSERATSLENEASRLRSELEAEQKHHRDKLAASSATIQSLQDQLATAQSNLTTQEANQASQLETARSAHNREIAENQEKYSASLGAREEEILRLQQENTLQKEALREQESTGEVSPHEVAELRQKVSQFEAQWKDAEDKRAALEQENAALRSSQQQVAQLEQQVLELQQSMTTEKEKTTAVLLELEEERVKSIHQDEKRKLEELTLQVERYSEQLRVLETEKDRLANVTDETEPEIKRLREAEDRHIQEITELTSANQSLKQSISEWEVRFTFLETELINAFGGHSATDAAATPSAQVEELIKKLSSTLQEVQQELDKQREHSQKLQEEQEEAHAQLTLIEQQKKIELDALNAELIETRQRFSDIKLQFTMEKSHFQERHEELHQAYQEIERLKGTLSSVEDSTELSDHLPITIPTASEAVVREDELPLSIRDTSESIEETLQSLRPGAGSDDEEVEEEEEGEEASEEFLAQRAKMLAKRSHILKEILDTEKSYVETLDILFEEILVPLKAAVEEGSPILTDAEIRTSFPSLEVIRGFNKLFLQNLSERLETEWSDDKCVGDLFIQMCLWLKAYSSYINCNSAAGECLREAEKSNSKFKSFLNAPRKRRAMKRKDISDYHIAPVQRLPRYVLLLNELLKSTPSDHADYNDLQQALEGIRTIADTVNASKRHYENKERLVETAARFVGNVQIIEPHRSWVFQTLGFKTAALAENPEGAGYKDVYVVILFTDILVYARAIESAFTSEDSQIRAALSKRTLRRGSVSGDVSPDLEIKKIYKVVATQLHEVEKHKLGLEIKETSNSVKPSRSSALRFFVRTPEEKCNWLLQFETAKAALCPAPTEKRHRRIKFPRKST